jgi:hypothetical protein
MIPVVLALRGAGYLVTIMDNDDTIQLRYLGDGEPDPTQVRPLLVALRAQKRAAIAALEAEAAFVPGPVLYPCSGCLAVGIRKLIPRLWRGCATHEPDWRDRLVSRLEAA